LGVGLLDRDPDSQTRNLALDRARGEQLGVLDDLRLPIDAERVSDAGNQEEQRDSRVVEQVSERVGDSVARALGISSVRSSSTRTKPAGSPRGETSSPPSGLAVAMHTKGERSTNCRVSAFAWLVSFSSVISWAR
jgi:hypothetical protein